LLNRDAVYGSLRTCDVLRDFVFSFHLDQNDAEVYAKWPEQNRFRFMYFSWVVFPSEEVSQIEDQESFRDMDTVALFELD
jgi:hypothetical protein